MVPQNRPRRRPYLIILDIFVCLLFELIGWTAGVVAAFGSDSLAATHDPATQTAVLIFAGIGLLFCIILPAL
ncbi:MAG: hypothetical protein M3Y81_21065, partial [Chloroflexota bacterium]|nr:hypothetical protein [Chloroflexota bacterium]